MREITRILFPYITIFYLIDCLTYIRANHLLFVSHFGQEFTLKRAGLHLVDLLPTSQAVISHQIPFCFTSRGVYFFSATLQANALYDHENFDFVPYEQMVAFEVDGQDVKLNNQTVIKAPSPLSAKHFLRLLQELKEVSAEERWPKIEAVLEETTDLKKIKSIRSSYAKHFRYVTILCTFLFLNIFVMVPLALWTEVGSYINFTILLLYIGLAYFSIVVLAYFLQRKIYKSQKGSRWIEIISLILSPVTAIHLLSHTTRDIYATFDYLTIAAALLPPDSFGHVMRRELLRIHDAKKQEHKDDDEWSEFWRQRERVLHTLVAQSGLSLPELFAAPQKQDQSVSHYCPMCLAEYVKAAQSCSDCGIELKQFE